MQRDMKELQRKMEQVTREANQRAAAQGVIDQRIETNKMRIQELSNTTVKFKEYAKFEQNLEYNVQNLKYRFETIEDTLR